MAKLLAAVAGVALAAGGFAAVQVAEPAGDVALATTTTAGTTATETAPADPAEPARGRTATVREPGEDVRGRCDEPEHARGPRCAGGAGAGRADDRERHGRRGSGRDDRSGPDSREADDDRGPSREDDHEDDRSGSNSGRS